MDRQLVNLWINQWPTAVFKTSWMYSTDFLKHVARESFCWAYISTLTCDGKMTTSTSPPFPKPQHKHVNNNSLSSKYYEGNMSGFCFIFNLVFMLPLFLQLKIFVELWLFWPFKEQKMKNNNFFFCKKKNSNHFEY